MPKFVSLTAAKTAGPGRYSVGDNLYLDVAKGGTASWMFMYRFCGKQREMSLGSAEIINLTDAKASRYQHLITLKVRKLDPLAVRDQQRAAERLVVIVPTFAVLLDEVIADRAKEWKAGSDQAARWKGSLTKHAGSIMSKPVNEITTQDVLDVLRPGWGNKTFHQMQDYIEAVLDVAKVKGVVATNVATWKGHLDAVLLSKSKKAKANQKALEADALPAVVASLHADAELDAKAILFVILTAARSGEVRGMLWSEVDLDKALWTVPAERMKEGVAHKVPLSSQAVALLRSLSRKPGVELVFPSKTGIQMSRKTFGMKMEAIGLKGEATTHGFRATFSTWANERNPELGKVIDAALAHMSKANGQNSNSEAAYNRATYLDQRVTLMQSWADFCFGPVNDNVMVEKKAKAA